MHDKTTWSNTYIDTTNLRPFG